MTETTDTSDGAAPKSAAELKEAYDKQRTFLLEELKDVEKALETFKSDEANELREEAKFRKNKLEQDELTFFLLYSTAKDIREFKERAEEMITRQNPLKRIPAPMWFSLVPALIVLYVIVLGILQSNYKSVVRSATQTAQAIATVTATATSTPSP
jgi:hypothetical protein